MPMLPHEVLAAGVVYPADLLAHGRPLGLLSVILSCFQSGLRILALSSYRVEIMEDNECNVILDRNSELKWRLLIPSLSCCTRT